MTAQIHTLDPSFQEFGVRCEQTISSWFDTLPFDKKHSTLHCVLQGGKVIILHYYSAHQAFQVEIPYLCTDSVCTDSVCTDSVCTDSVCTDSVWIEPDHLPPKCKSVCIVYEHSV